MVPLEDGPPIWDETPAAPPTAPVTDVESYVALMRQIATALDIPVTEPNVQGAAATIYIQRSRR
jgi:hypothetical protein